MLGYVLTLASFVTEIKRHSYRSKGCGPIRSTLCHGHKIDTVAKPHLN